MGNSPFTAYPFFNACSIEASIDEVLDLRHRRAKVSRELSFFSYASSARFLVVHPFID